MNRRDLLSSTAVLPPPPEARVYARDLQPGSVYSFISRESPQTLTREDFIHAMERMESRPRQPFISREEMEELSRRPIPVDVGRNYFQQTRMVTYREYLEMDEMEKIAFCGDGSGRPLGIFK